MVWKIRKKVHGAPWLDLPAIRKRETQESRGWVQITVHIRVCSQMTRGASVRKKKVVSVYLASGTSIHLPWPSELHDSPCHIRPPHLRLRQPLSRQTCYSGNV